MSKIGKQPIEIPEGVEASIIENKVSIKGPKGELCLTIPSALEVLIKRQEILVRPREGFKNISALWGLIRALLANHLIGVSRGFEKKLEIIGVGYKAAVEGEKMLKLSLGFSHPVNMEIPEGISVKAEKNLLTVSGIDKQKVGQFAANIRSKRPPEPYKGKGVRYLDEKIRKKEGKKAVSAA